MCANTVFICGFPSSGTDLLRNILNAHSKIVIGGEFPLLPSLVKSCSAIVKSADIQNVQEKLRRCDIYGNLKNADIDLTAETDLPFNDIYARMLSPDDFVWYGNKTPQNTENIEQLDKLFPSAKFIIIVRDIRDTVLSWQRKWGKDMLLCASKWDKRMRLGEAAAAKLSPGRYMYVAYEDILGKLKPQLERICDFLNLEFDSRMLEFHEHVDELVPGKLNFGEAIISDNKNKWVEALDKSTLRRVEEIAWPTMHRFSYQPTVATAHHPIRNLERLHGLLSDSLSMLFVGNRALYKDRFRARMTAIRLLARTLFSRLIGRTN
jgi:hypothetical protein